MMTEKIDTMIALAAAIGANCIPCFESLYEKAKGLGISDEEIVRIFETANKVKTGASAFIKNAVKDVTGISQEAFQSSCSETSKSCCC